jgi:hypothetical protein
MGPFYGREKGASDMVTQWPARRVSARPAIYSTLMGSVVGSAITTHDFRNGDLSQMNSYKRQYFFPAAILLPRRRQAKVTLLLLCQSDPALRTRLGTDFCSWAK